jgi:SulP family sulfate permease
VLLSGIQPDHENVFQSLGIYDHLAHERHIFATTPEAIAHAHAHVHKMHEDVSAGTES